MRTWVKILLAVVLGVVVTVGIYFGRNAIQQYASYGYSGLFLVSVLGNATLIFPVPVLAVVFGSGAVLNPWLVGIVAGCGAAIGELTGFFAGSTGKTLIKQETYTRIEPYIIRWGAIALSVLAFIPNPFFDVGGIIAGSLRMPWWKFLIAAAIGKTARFILLGLLGDGVLG